MQQIVQIVGRSRDWSGPTSLKACAEINAPRRRSGHEERSSGADRGQPGAQPHEAPSARDDCAISRSQAAPACSVIQFQIRRRTNF
jgi:hypothetical protein